MGNKAGRLWILAERTGTDLLAEQVVRQRGWIILFGHGVCSAPLEMLKYNPRHIVSSVFRQQMQYLLLRGYRFISMTEGVERLRAGLPMDKLVTLTLDDGFRNVVDNAYPVMKELGLTGCLFVVTSCVNSDRLLWTDMVDLVCWYNRGKTFFSLEFPDGQHLYDLRDDSAYALTTKSIKRSFRSISDSQRLKYFEQIERTFAEIPTELIPEDLRFADWEQLNGLDPTILEIGNHTLSHPNLVRVDDPHRLRSEVFDSKKVLEERLDRSVCHFCYPGGSYNAAVLAEVQSAGHTSAVTINYGVNTGCALPFELERVEIPASLSEFKAKISGLEAVLLKIKGFFSHGR